MTDPALPADSPAPPLVRVVRGHPTAHELAALVAVLRLAEAERERPAVRPRPQPRPAPTLQSDRWSLQR
jgi:hypothetical protein